MRQSVLQRSDLYDLSSIDGLLLSSVPSCENPSGHPGSSTYLFSDPEGVRITLNSSGAITSGASYNPYGQLTAGGVSSVTPFGYAGGYTDPTGLIYLVSRYYDPSTGQFISVDPLVGITGQPYEYVNGDPLNFIDPLGLCNANVFSGSFWTKGNCISGAVGGPNGGGSQPWYMSDPFKSNQGESPTRSQYVYGCATFIVVQLCVDVTNQGGIILSLGLGAGFPGISGGYGWIHRGQGESSCQVDRYLQGPTLDASGGIGLGGSVIWGNEGRTGSHDWGSQFGLSTPGAGIFQEWGIQLYPGTR